MQGLIIAAIIIAFVFNVYKNFKKEMEKAKARGQGAEGNQQPPMEAETVVPRQRPVHKPVVVQPYQSTYDQAQKTTEKPVFESNKQDYFREQAAKKELRSLKSAKKAPVLDYYNPEIPSLEVIENRRIHQSHKHGYTPPLRKEKHYAADFNFKQALIYDAILRRPEY